MVDTNFYKTFDKFVMDIVISLTDRDIATESIYYAHEDDSDDAQSFDDDGYQLVMAGLRIGHPKQSSNLMGDVSSVYALTFHRRRFGEYERECILFLRELKARNVISIEPCLPTRQTTTQHPDDCDDFRQLYCHWCRRQRQRPYRFADRRFVKRKTVRPKQPDHTIFFNLKINPKIPLAPQIDVYKRLFVNGLLAIVDAVERPRRSLNGLCMNAINRFKLRQRYADDKNAIHAMQVSEPQRQYDYNQHVRKLLQMSQNI